MSAWKECGRFTHLYSYLPLPLHLELESNPSCAVKHRDPSGMKQTIQMHLLNIDGLLLREQVFFFPFFFVQAKKHFLQGSERMKPFHQDLYYQTSQSDVGASWNTIQQNAMRRNLAVFCCFCFCFSLLVVVVVVYHEEAASFFRDDIRSFMPCHWQATSSPH